MRGLGAGQSRRSALPVRGALHPRSAVARALRLAEAIQARSAGMAHPRSRSPMTLLNRLAHPPAARAATIRLDVNVINLGRGRSSPLWLRGPGPTRPANTIRVAAPVRPIDRALTEMTRPTAPGSQPTVQDTIRRIVEQHVRVETAARYRLTNLAPMGRPFQPAASGRPAWQAAPELQPPLRQVVRPAAAPLASPEKAAGAGASSSTAPGTPAQPTAPPLDVNRLTDQVIQAIDRRIIAGRERLGRI